MKKNELWQIMMTCITTLEKLSGRKASPEELYSALGWEYNAVLAEYLKSNVVMA